MTNYNQPAKNHNLYLRKTHHGKLMDFHQGNVLVQPMEVTALIP